MGADPLHLSSNPSTKNLEKRASFWAIYAANILWTPFYEIIYSHQDAAYDVNAGVKNIVNLYQGRTKQLLVKLSISQVLFLAIAGILGEAGVMYWTFGVLGSASTLAMIIMKVDLDSPDDCAWWFKVGCWAFTGGAMTAGMLGDYLVAV